MIGLKNSSFFLSRQVVKYNVKCFKVEKSLGIKRKKFFLISNFKNFIASSLLEFLT